MRLRTYALLASVSAAACAGTAAHAQSAAPQPGAAREFKIGARVAAFYDSNVSRSSVALSGARDLSRSDYVLRPEATASIVQPLGRQMVFINGAAGYDFYRRNDDLNRRRYDVTVGGLGAVGPCAQTGTASFRAAQSDLGDVDLTTVKNLQKTMSFTAGVTCGRSVGPTVGLAAQRSDVKNSARTLKVSDSTTAGVSASFGYRNPTLGTISAYYSYSETEQPNRIIVGRPVGDGFHVESAGVNLQRKFGSRLDVLAAAGGMRLTREFAPPGASLKITGATYNGAATYRAGSRLTLSLNASRAFQPSATAGKLYDVTTRGDIGARYKLGSRFSVSLSQAVVDTKSNRDTALPGLVVTKSRTYSTAGTILYTQNQHASVAMDVRYDDRETDVPSFNYNAVRVGLTLAANF